MNAKNKGLLVLVRHGESRFNKLNLFTGWIDVALTESGIKEAHHVASHCKHFDYDAVFTSHLERAHETLLIILSYQRKIGIFQHYSDAKYNIVKNRAISLKKEIIPIFSNRALNERSYGSLQGINKEDAIKKFGALKILEWRRGFTKRPPNGESLRDVYERAIPYFCTKILSRLRRGETILIVGHGNTLRVIIKYLEDIPDDKIPFVDLSFGKPLVYEYKNSKFQRVSGKYNFERSLRTPHDLIKKIKFISLCQIKKKNRNGHLLANKNGGGQGL